MYFPISVKSWQLELCTCWVSAWRREWALTLFTRRGDGRCCCALVFLGACPQEPDNKIWAPLDQSSQRPDVSGGSQWCDPQYLLCVWEESPHRASEEMQMYSLCFGGFVKCWHVVACLLTEKKLKNDGVTAWEIGLGDLQFSNVQPDLWGEVRM